MDNQENISISAKMENNPYNYIQNDNTFRDWMKYDQSVRECNVLI